MNNFGNNFGNNFRNNEQLVASVDVGAKKDRSAKHAIRFRFVDFANLQQKRGEVVESPSLPCHGYLWKLHLYPRGDDFSNEGTTHVSIYLVLVDTNGESVKTEFSLRAGNKNYKAKHTWKANDKNVPLGWSSFEERATVLDQANQFVDYDGTLTVKVNIQIVQDASKIWCPTGTLKEDMKDALNSKSFSDITFSVGGKHFYAHRIVLATRAPGLSEVLGNKAQQVVEMGEIDPSIFEALLHYLYSDDIPALFMDRGTGAMKMLLDLADKYECLNLKLRVEAMIAESAITDDNVVDLLLYADGKNCALLKEVTLNYFATNNENVMQSEAFKQLDSPNLLREMMVSALTPTDFDQDEDNIESMSVATLRMKLHDAGSEIDGSRETLVNLLKRSSKTDESAGDGSD